MGTRARRLAVAGVICAGVWASYGAMAEAQSVPADFLPGLQQIVNLSKAGMSDDFIHTYITNSGRSYTLSVEDIVYLHEQGVSDSVIQALIQTLPAASTNTAPAYPAPVAPPDSAAPATTPSEPAPEASQVAQAPATVDVSTPPTMDYFQNQLSPYGTWVNVAGYGQCWAPAVAPGWRPYCDGGHWVYTDSGWFWQSDYVWGGIPFHYGRWTYTTVGWVWVPGYEYAPAWVAWRHADEDGYVGWAPLPPGAQFVGGSWMFNGNVVGANFDFGLGATFFTFVDYGHLCSADFHPYFLRRDRFDYVFRRSVFENHFDDDHGRLFNHGVDRDRVSAFAHQDIRIERAEDLRHEDEQRRGAFQNYNNHRYDDGHSFGQQRNSGQFIAPNQSGGHVGGPVQYQGNQGQPHSGQFHGSLNDAGQYQMGGSFAAPNQVQFSPPAAGSFQTQNGSHNVNPRPGQNALGTHVNNTVVLNNNLPNPYPPSGSFSNPNSFAQHVPVTANRPAQYEGYQPVLRQGQPQNVPHNQPSIRVGDGQGQYHQTVAAPSPVSRPSRPQPGSGSFPGGGHYGGAGAGNGNGNVGNSHNSGSH